GRPPRLLRGNLADLRLPNTVIIDQLAIERLSGGRPRPIDLGDTLEINDREARVVGVCHTERQFFGYPYVFTTYDQALQYAPRMRKMLSIILAEPQPGRSAAEVAQAIERETGLRAYTVPELGDATLDFIWKNTGIPASFMTTITLGFLVGIAVAGQTFYSFILENLRHLGALKAMGASNGLLARMLLLQALTVGSIGYGMGIGLTAVFGYVATTFGSGAFPFIFQPPALVFTAVAILVICLFSALLGIRKVAALEPAVVFRG
ncbi:MAG: ABC transporter permease, partial [Verrucomicrobiota bacterium]